MGRSVLRGALPRYLVFLAFAVSAFAAHAWTAGSDGGAGATTASPDTESGPYRGVVGPVGTAEP
ncbi:MAG TPA: hypothetical protein DD502_18650, partial [Cupriavidus sp.]|nr:hypothetical protein [Cupriavidus sp.]